MYHSSEINNPIFPSGFSGEMIPNYDTNLIPRALRTVGTQRKTRIYKPKLASNHHNREGKGTQGRYSEASGNNSKYFGESQISSNPLKRTNLDILRITQKVRTLRPCVAYIHCATWGRFCIHFFRFPFPIMTLVSHSLYKWICFHKVSTRNPKNRTEENIRPNRTAAFHSGNVQFVGFLLKDSLLLHKIRNWHLAFRLIFYN